MISERIKRNYGTIAFITLAFIVDVVTGNLVRGAADSWEQAYWMANDFCQNRSYFETALVVVFIPAFVWYTQSYRPKFDVFDLALFALWCLSFLMTNFDYQDNQNLRDVDIDIRAYSIIAVGIIILKIVTVNKLWNRILFKTRR